MQADLRAVRKSRGMTLQQLADKVGGHPGNLSRLERGQEFPRPAKARRLAAALSLSVEQVYAAITTASAKAGTPSAQGGCHAG